MSAPKKLTAGEKHLLRLIEKEQACTEGWAPVGKMVYPHVVQALPAELIEHEPIGDEGRGRVRLSAKGRALVDVMDYL